MKRPRVLCELSAYLAILLRSGLRSGREADPPVALLESPAEMERDGPAPAFFLHLYTIAPERRAPRAGVLEATDEGRDTTRLEIRRPPLWVACRYLAAVRGRAREEEEEMAAALLRTLHDHPLLSSDEIPSLRVPGIADRYPLELVEEREGWREAGLARPRLTVAFQVSVPIPSALSEPLARVLDREISLEELP